MTSSLYVKQDSIPLVEAGQQIMFILRDPAMPSSRPSLYISALVTGTQIILKSGQGPNTDTYVSPVTIDLC